MNVLYIWVTRAVFFMLCCLIISTNPVKSQNQTGGDPLGGSTNVYDSLAALYEDPKGFGDYPPIWEVPQMNSNFDPHFILVMLEADPRINDFPITQNDYIGGFYTDDSGELRCGGAASWQDTINIVIKLFANDSDTPEKDGFSYAETIHFKLFSWTTQKEYDIDVIEFNTSGLYTSTNKWFPIGVSQVVDLQALEDMDFYIQVDNNPLCIGNQLSLSAIEFIGTGGPYSYEWSSDPVGFTSTLSIPSPTTPSGTTTYFLTVDDGLLTSDHQLTVLVNEPQQVFAGDDGSVCGNESISLNGSALNYESIGWTSSGDGIFDDPTSFNAIYTPGDIDKQNGNTTITLLAYPLSPCPDTISDDLLLHLLPLPTIDQGEDMSACGNDAIIVVADGQSYSTIIWTTTGDGEFLDPNAVSTQYSPGPNDLNAGTVSIEACVNAISPCAANACMEFSISFLDGPTCNAPSSRTKCENVPVPMAGIANNNNGILWTTQGDGYFLDPSVINTKYMAGPEDCVNGGTIVTLNALPISPCSTPATKNMTIVLKPMPKVDAGEDMIVADYENIYLTATASDYTTILWETNGDGEFTSPTQTTTQYIPGENEISLGATMITLTANAATPCVGATSDQTTIYYGDFTTVYAGDDISSCSGDDILLEGSSSNYQSVIWATSGDGSFQNINDLSTIYTPGINDLASGQITLTLSATPPPPETTPVVDELNVTFFNDATVVACDDQLICESQNVQLTASATNSGSVQWISNGDGVFSNANILNPTYTPGSGDKLSGNVNLSITVASIQPCTFSAVDQVNISIVNDPVAIAGSDTEICESSVLSLTGQAQNYQETLWATNGDGYFENPEALATNYHPGIQDIQNGSVELTLNATPEAPCVASGSDMLVLVVNKLAEAAAGSDHSICETETVTLNGSASNYSSVTWSTSGDGIFTNPNSSVTNYTPGNQDKVNGTVSVTIIASPLGSCSLAAEDISTIDITSTPFSNAGSNITICENEQINLSGQAQNYSSINWSSTGDGTFGNPNLLSTSYTPGPNDVNSGLTTLCLAVTSSGACQSENDCITVTIISLPEVFAGNDDIVSYGSSYSIQEAIADNAQSLLWTTLNGAGIFSNTSIANPSYTPAIDDLDESPITIVLTAEPISPCLIGSADSFELTVTSDCVDAVAFAGLDATNCETHDFEITGSNVENYSSIVWTTTGDGSFNNPNIINPVYTQGANDLSNGSVSLCLTAMAIDNCQGASDCLTLSFQELPTVNAGEDLTICAGTTALVNASGTHYNTLTWSTSGDGIFDNNGESSTIYTPGQSDINNGTTTLCATATGIAGCEEAVDCMIIQIQDAPIANAGNDQDICSNSTAFLNGQAENHDFVLWETAGDGSFNNSNALSPTYTPGAQDISDGAVELCFTAYGLYGCANNSDCMSLTLYELPIASAGTNKTICEDDIVSLSGDAENYQSIAWSTYGDGSFNDENILNAEYFPGPNDINNGLVTLCLASTGLSNCGNTENCIDITINKQAIVDAGADQVICSGDNAALFGSAENYSTLIWQTSGDGTFTNPLSPTTGYIPGTLDINSGTVNICLNASGLSGCDGQSHCVTLTIEEPPVVSAGGADLICEGDIIQLDATATNYSSILWETTGDGSFNNPSIVNPGYTPGPNDISSGQMELCITASPIQGCNAVSDCVTAYIQSNPLVNAGSDVTIAEGETFTATEANAEGYTALLWSTSGTGTFNDATSLNTVYSPSNMDYINGSVILSLNATAVNPCTLSSENQMVITFPASCTPLADAGEDAATCEDQFAQLSGLVLNADSFEWTTSGDGSFDDANLIDPIYTPGENDTQIGIVELCLTAFATDTCEDQLDCLTLTIVKKTEANAGNNRTVPTYVSIEMSDAYAKNFELIQWTTLNGTGAFNDENAINPSYNPGFADWLQGYVLLQVATSPISPCDVFSDDIAEISFMDECLDAIVTTAVEIHSCDIAPSVDVDASADYYTSLNWTTTGDGTFNMSNILTPEYLCGVNDRAAGQVKLYLEASAYNECNSAIDSVILFLHSAPVANAGSDMTLCGNQNIEITGTASEYKNFSWSTSGDGTFNNQNTLTPTYVPGNNDLLGGTVSICFDVEGYGLYSVVSDCFELTFKTPPEISAGINTTICAEESVILEAVGQNFASLNWQSSGDGTFSDNSLLNAVYTPGSDDLITGEVELCITAFANDGCTDISNCLTLTIQNSPQAYAGEDLDIDVGLLFDIVNATASFSNTVSWETSGTGSFDDSTTLNPVYTPSTDDHNQGFVILSLSASPVTPCSVSDIDEMKLGFNQTCQDATANAGGNLVVCSNENILLNASAENQTGILWETQGDGAFDNPSERNATYYPGSNDKTSGFVNLCFTAFAHGTCSDDTECINVTFIDPPVIDAGNDHSVCESTTEVLLSGVAENHTTVSWTTEGDGTFSNSNSLTPVYYPGGSDILNGTVTLTLIASSDNCTDITDDIIINLEKSPIAFAGDDVTICSTENIILSDAITMNEASLVWSSDGDGTFDNPGVLNATYTPGENDLQTGQVEFCLTAFADGQCEDATDCITIFVEAEPTVSAGDNFVVCENETIQLSGTVENSNTIFWLTSGDGSFDNANIATPVYNPGTADVSNGSVSLTLTANAQGLCEDATDLVVVNIEKEPVVDAGLELTICENESINLAGSAEHYSGILWETNGDGSFDNSAILSAVYTPGANDKLTGQVELCMNAFANGQCADAADCISIVIETSPSADAGDSFSVCENETIQLSGTVENSNTIFLLTSGDGSFENANIANPFYNPGSTDVSNGSVSLTLTANAQGLCEDATDQVVVSIEKAPVADAGQDLTVCENEVVSLNADAQNYSSINWTSNGDGSFGDAAALITSYTPGENDIVNGTVELCLTTNAIDQCNIIADCIIITIKSAPTTNAGEDYAICETSPFFILSGQASFFDNLIWTTDGDGYFDDPEILDSKYYPGTNDLATGFVTICLEASNSSECGSIQDCMVLSFFDGPSVDVGDDLEICQNIIPVVSAQVQNSESLLWSTNGDGIFSHPTFSTSQYTPGPSDIQSGSVSLSLTAFGSEGCESNLDSITINIKQEPVSHAGENSTIYKGETYYLADAYIINAKDCDWTSNGTGIFEDNKSVNCIYFPTQEDYDAEEVELILCAQPEEPCLVSSTDSMILAFVETCIDATANAGDDIIACIGPNVDLNGTASDYTSVLWETNGDGSFTDPNSMVTEYVPGSEDLNNMQVELCLNAYAVEPCVDAKDCLTLTFQDGASANAGNDIDVCSTVSYVQLSGSTSNSTGFSWATTGTGSFVPPTIIAPKYFPSFYDKFIGQVNIILTAQHAECEPTKDTLTLTLHPNPMADAGGDATICANETHTTITASATDEQSVLWETNGDGYFDDAESILTTYYPGTSDLQNSTVELCLTAYGFASCGNVTDCMTLMLNESAIVDAGNNQTICEDESVQLIATADNYDEVLWTTSGDGSFNDPTILNPIYYPGDLDIQNSIVTLSVEVISASDCGNASDNITIALELSPVAQAGDDKTVCEDQSMQLNGLAENYSSVEWTTSGNGSFDDAFTTDAVYTPGSEDISNGQAELCFTAYSISLCSDVSDCLTLTIQHAPVANAGDDETVCITSVFYTLNGTASFQSGSSWNTSGDGYFEDATALTSKYYPGAADLSAGNVSLCLTANGIASCDPVEDCMELSFQASPTLEAGLDLTICENEIADLSASAQNYSSVEWSTSGSGIFDTQNSLDAVYTPSESDIDAGFVDLCLTAYGLSDCTEVSDCLTLTLQANPSAYAGENIEVCENQVANLNGQAENYSSVIWSTNGDGTFGNSGELVTTYTSGSGDIFNGTVELCLQTIGFEGCGPAMDCITLSIQKLPTVVAGDDLSICESESPTFTGAAQNYSSVLWTTNGDGAFASPDQLSSSYTPGENDIANGFVQVCLEAVGMGSCETVQDCLDVSIYKLPEVQAGENQSICAGQTIEVSGQAQNYQSVQWTTSGNGVFANPFALNTSYTPGSEDHIAGSADLCLTAVSMGTCDDAIDCLTLTVQQLPTASAGEDIEVCENNNAPLNGQASNYSSIFWSTSGSGSFSNPQSLSTVYYPSQQDIQDGTVELCLKANGISGCGDITDCLTVNINPLPEAIAGPDVTICESGSLSLSGQAGNADGVLWETTGDGIFDDNSVLETTYYPGPQDMLNGTAQICLTAMGMNSCPDHTDCLTLILQPEVLVFAGDDFSSCETDGVLLNGWAENYASVLWSSNGDGSFTNPALLNASYSPGPADLFNGSVEFCLIATGLNGCNDAQDCVTMDIINIPTAYAGEDDTINQGDVFVTNQAFTINAFGVLWETSGLGTFEDANALVTTYTPNNIDITNGFVYLVLTAMPNSPCSLNAVDSLTLSINQTGCVDAIAMAGDDATICEDQTYNIAGTAYFYASTLWSSSGDGSFDDPALLDAVYTPGEFDYLNGSVDICLTAFAEDTCQNSTDCFTLYFQKPPVVFAGSDNTIPKYEVYHINDSYTENYNFVQWSTTNGTGFFDCETCVNPTYQPGPIDWLQGYVELQISISPILPCEVFVDDKVFIWFTDGCDDAVADAGEDIDVCSLNDAVQLDASATHFSSLSWSTSGDGSFDHANTINPVYTLGENDKINGQVILSLDAEAFADCNAASDDVLISIHGEPAASVEDDFSVCGADGFTISGSADNYSDFSWSSTGDGTFIDENTFNPTYTPGDGDLANGGTTICLEAQGYGTCQPVSACLFIEIIHLPVAFAGDDDTVCETANHQLSATAENYSSISWQTNGDGVFDDPSSLSAVYTPGDGDILNGEASLCLQLVGLNDCGNSSDCMTLTIQSNPVAYAGMDATIFYGENYSLDDATAFNFNECLWTTSGTGTFEEPTDIIAVYVPTYEDFVAETVELKITVSAQDPCVLTAEDEMVLTILEACSDAIADAGEDFTACMPGEISLNGFAENHESVLWETNGDGSFTEPNSLVSEYIPGPNDSLAGFAEVCLTAFARSVCLDATDCVVITFTDAPVVLAGDDITLCETSGMVILSAFADHYSDVLWTTSGNGSFLDTTNFETAYFLGPDDLLAGQVTLTITANNELCQSVSDELIVTISPSVVLYAGENTSICDTGSFNITDAFVANAASTLWTTSGDGYFVDASNVNTAYFPGENDIVAGEVELCLAATAHEPCEDASQCITLTVLPSASVDAGEDITVCETEIVILNASATHYGQVTWSTSGDGTFGDASALDAEYTFGEQDIAAGFVTLTVQVSSSNGCSDDSDDIVIAIDRAPMAQAGEDFTVCFPGEILLSGSAVNYNSLLWESDGDGSFTEPNSLETQYLPGDDDIAAGFVQVCLNAYAEGVCTDAVDCLTITLTNAPLVVAGDDITICETEGMVNLAATADHYSDVSWTTSGNGFFQDATSLETVYILGPDDLLAGQVTLTITANSEHCPSVSDELIVTISPSVILYAGENTSICDSESFNVTDAFVANAVSTLWTTSGDGYFEDASIVYTAYFPGDNDIIAGGVELCLAAVAHEPCEDASQCITLTILPSSSVDAGEDITICETESVMLSADATEYDQLLWSTSGDGIFSDATQLDAEYTLGELDIANGIVTLTLEVTSSFGCEIESDEIIISIFQNPEVFAGDDVTICANEALDISGEATDYLSLEWQSSGDGNFDNASELSTTYNPGPNDVILGDVELCLVALGVEPCFGTASDCLTLSIKQTPYVEVGDTIRICGAQTISLNPTVENYDELLWTTSGDGTFGDASIAQTTYQPGSQDITNAEFELCLTASSQGNCGDVTDCVSVKVSKLSIAYAGPNAQIIEGESFNTSSAFAKNYSEVTWSTSGSGTFEDEHAVHTMYFPSEDDVSAESVTLTISVHPQFPCTSVANDDLLLTIIGECEDAIVNAGTDEMVCENQIMVQLSATAAHVSSLSWSTAGDGIFNNQNILNPEYTLGDDDLVAESVKLYLFGESFGDCESAVDSLMISVINSPTVYAGNDQAICEGDEVELLDANASDFESVIWSTDGDGIFENNNHVNTTYYPGTMDIQNGLVELNLMAEPLDPCTTALESSLLISITKLTTVFAGYDLTICADEEVELTEANATNYAIVIWSTDGDGTYGDVNLLNTTYQPGLDDVENGFAELKITAEPFDPCTAVAQSNLLVTINKFPIILQDIVDQEVLIDNHAIFIIEATDVEGYEWYGPLGFIPDNDLPELEIKNVGFEDAGEYYCLLTNSCGAETSSTAMLIVYEDQTVGYTPGWGGSSSWIAPYDPSVENMFKDVEDKLIIMKNFANVYYPGYNINTMGNWDTQDAYEAKFSEPVELQFKGVANTNRIVELNAGWNYLPVVVACPVDIDDLFGNMAEVELIKEIAGNGIYWPDQGVNTIGELLPGNAYFIRMSDAVDVEFDECDVVFKSTFISSAQRPENQTAWNEITYTPATHLIAIDQEVLDLVNVGDIIGAFNEDGLCAGTMEVQLQNNSLTLYGEDQLTEPIDGFAENSLIRFKVFRPQTGEEFELKVRFDQSFSNANGTFVTHGISKILDAEFNALSVLETSSEEINIYPNPSFGQVNISGVKKASTIEIYTSGGQVLQTITLGSNHTGSNVLAVDLSAYPSGIIYFRITGTDKVEVKKVILK